MDDCFSGFFLFLGVGMVSCGGDGGVLLRVVRRDKWVGGEDGL